jgi:hypothetical protein
VTSILHRPTREKINEETETLSNARDKMDLADKQKFRYWVTEEYITFSSRKGTSSKIYHIQGHKKFFRILKQNKKIANDLFSPQWNETRNQ